MENGVSPTVLIAVGVIQIATILAVAAKGFRNARERFSIPHVLWWAFLISLTALPFAAILIWQPPQERETYRALIPTAVFAPLGVSLLLAFICIYRKERKHRADEYPGPTSRADLRARLEMAPSPNRSRMRRIDHPPDEREALSLIPLPAEFSFNTREFNKTLIFLPAFCFGAIFLAGLIGSYPLRYTIRWALVFPAIVTPLFWMIGSRSTHRSYVISREGIILRRFGRDLEQLSWEDIADIRPWPLTLVTSSGDRISFALGRPEMLRAREAMIHALDHARDA